MERFCSFHAVGEVWHQENGRWVFDEYYEYDGVCSAEDDPLCAAMKQSPDMRLCNRNCRAYFAPGGNP